MKQVADAMDDEIDEHWNAANIPMRNPTDGRPSMLRQEAEVIEEAFRRVATKLGITLREE